MAEAAAYIYGMFIKDMNIRYIGKALDPRDRLAHHIADVRNYPCQSKKARWIAESLLNKQPPVIVILDVISQQGWGAKEKEWLERYTALGFDLLNGHAGGGGGKPGIRTPKPKAPRRIFNTVHTVGEIIPYEATDDMDSWLALYGERVRNNLVRGGVPLVSKV